MYFKTDEKSNHLTFKRFSSLFTLMVLGLLLASCSSDDETEPDLDEPDVVFNLTAEGREFYIEGDDEENPHLAVTEGDLVQVNLEVTGGTHDWVVDEFGAATEQIDEGETYTIEFVADQSGVFEYYCSRGSHREDGMYGAFIVREVGQGEPDVVFNLTAEDREFYIEGDDEENPDLVVTEGDLVQVNLQVTGGTHDWVVDEFDAATEQIGEGHRNTIEFVADQSGVFEYYCSRGSHQQEGMYGNFIVE